MPDELYLQLRDFLDRLPGGCPATESGVELKLLRKLFSPEEAEMAMRLRLFPEPPSVIAGRCGLTESQAAERLEEMARKGLIFRVRRGDQVFYQAQQFIVGIYEFHLNQIDEEMSELMEEYLPYFRDTGARQFRVVPVGSAVDTTPAVASYDRIKELVKDQEIIAVAPCICRKEQGLLGKECAHTLETCVTFGVAAQYYIENGLGRIISVDEALDLLRKAEEEALVLQPTNAKEIINICICCGCCCGVLRVLKMQERPADYVQTSFQAKIDPRLCSGCGTCMERCQMESIQQLEESMRVEEGRCIGCGLCVSTCEQGAISLVPKTGVSSLPASYLNMLSMIASEQGKGFGKLNWMMKRTTMRRFFKVVPILYKTRLVKPVADQLAKRGWI